MRMKNPPGQRERARVLRRRQTLAEQRLWKELRDRRFYGVKFKRQQIIGSYIADFCSKSHKLVIEIDGGQHATQILYDRKRERVIEEHGFRIIRFWNTDVLENMDGVLTRIAQITVVQTSSPSGGED